jgi:hypothetical protein
VIQNTTYLVEAQERNQQHQSAINDDCKSLTRVLNSLNNCVLIRRRCSFGVACVPGVRSVLGCQEDIPSNVYFS